MINAEQILKTIRLTEKSNKLSSNYGQYTFEVYPSATKHTVRAAVEQTFKVTVTRVNIQNRKGKPKRSRQGRPIKTSDSKRAIVTLKTGDKIELT
ncbi:MAG: 50S ribosomal protein L23 [Lacunisphaera sp.]|jgi:large subunit ribosomal protein L23|nr:50S ribosomal protein L23 [Lacunisphaera sp.]